MVKHVILWQLKDELSDAEKAAVKEGIKVLGFGFMDTEELGRRITETYYAVNGRPE